MVIIAASRGMGIVGSILTPSMADAGENCVKSPYRLDDKIII